MDPQEKCECSGAPSIRGSKLNLQIWLGLCEAFIMSAHAIDSAIVAYMHRPDGQSKADLVATGPEGLNRTLQIWFDATSADRRMYPKDKARWAIDARADALDVLARAFPTPFVDGIEDDGISITLHSILGEVDDLRAVSILCAHVISDEWLVRYDAVRALGDPNLVVRSRAVEENHRWDPDRAKELYEDQLQDESLTPLLRAEAESALQNLKLGLPVSDPS